MTSPDPTWEGRSKNKRKRKRNKTRLGELTDSAAGQQPGGMQMPGGMPGMGGPGMGGGQGGLLFDAPQTAWIGWN